MNKIDLVADAHQQLGLNIQLKRKKLVTLHTSQSLSIKAYENFHTKKCCSIVTILWSVLFIEDVNMRVDTEIITNFIRGNEGILIGITERPD